MNEWMNEWDQKIWKFWERRFKALPKVASKKSHFNIKILNCEQFMTFLAQMPDSHTVRLQFDFVFLGGK